MQGQAVWRRSSTILSLSRVLMRDKDLRTDTRVSVDFTAGSERTATSCRISSSMQDLFFYPPRLCLARLPLQWRGLAPDGMVRTLEAAAVDLQWTCAGENEKKEEVGVKMKKQIQQ